jgi:hypothetical protein
MQHAGVNIFNLVDCFDWHVYDSFQQINHKCREAYKISIILKTTIYLNKKNEEICTTQCSINWSLLFFSPSVFCVTEIIDIINAYQDFGENFHFSIRGSLSHSHSHIYSPVSGPLSYYGIGSGFMAFQGKQNYNPTKDGFRKKSICMQYGNSMERWQQGHLHLEITDNIISLSYILYIGQYVVTYILILNVISCKCVYFLLKKKDEIENVFYNKWVGYSVCVYIYIWVGMVTTDHLVGYGSVQL